jgi:hypothetical protein
MTMYVTAFQSGVYSITGVVLAVLIAKILHIIERKLMG